MQSARYGLEVGALLGQAWIIPYNDRRQMPDGAWAKVMTAHFQIGYKGLIVLARRSKTIKTIAAETVYEADHFEVELGLHANLVHRLDIRKPRGEPIAYYAAVELENGGVQFKVLTKDDATKHRDNYSRGYQQSPEDNPWVTNFGAMALKTVIIQTLKLCPMSVEALEAVGREERGLEMRNVTGTGLDALPPPSEEAEIIREPVPEPDKVPAGARPTAARAAAAKAAGRAPRAARAPEEPPVDAGDAEGPTDAASGRLDPTELGMRNQLMAYIVRALPKADQAWFISELDGTRGIEALAAMFKRLKQKYEDPTT
jgi:recombination protein RecT